jgi:hypothetical protein
LIISFSLTGAESAFGRSQAAWAGAGITGLVALITDSSSQSKAVTAAVIAVWAILAIAV